MPSVHMRGDVLFCNDPGFFKEAMERKQCTWKVTSNRPQMIPKGFPPPHRPILVKFYKLRALFRMLAVSFLGRLKHTHALLSVMTSLTSINFSYWSQYPCQAIGTCKVVIWRPALGVPPVGVLASSCLGRKSCRCEVLGGRGMGTKKRG